MLDLKNFRILFFFLPYSVVTYNRTAIIKMKEHNNENRNHEREREMETLTGRREMVCPEGKIDVLTGDNICQHDFPEDQNHRSIMGWFDYWFDHRSVEHRKAWAISKDLVGNPMQWNDDPATSKDEIATHINRVTAKLGYTQLTDGGSRMCKEIPEYLRCGNCDGSGTYNGTPCHYCDGTGIYDCDDDE